MGMAASQARLLSITSRLSDNELRSQLINNQKIRLATESSNVSDNYVQALNNAQMMFTNYDKDNNKSYQNLTFNALTAYNPYNNQYGLSNQNGSLLVSETDAKNFEQIKASGGGLNDFLELYGLEYTTSFFDADGILSKYLDGNGHVTVGSYVDETGATIWNTTGRTIDEIKEMYFGTNGQVGLDGRVHIGYEQIPSDPNFIEFDSLSGSFMNAQDRLLEIASPAVRKYINTEKEPISGQTLNDIKNAANSLNPEDTNALTTAEGLLGSLSGLMDEYKSVLGCDEYFDGLKASIAAYDTHTTTLTPDFDTSPTGYDVYYINKDSGDDVFLGVTVSEADSTTIQAPGIKFYTAPGTEYNIISGRIEEVKDDDNNVIGYNRITVSRDAVNNSTTYTYEYADNYDGNLANWKPDESIIQTYYFDADGNLKCDKTEKTSVQEAKVNQIVDFINSFIDNFDYESNIDYSNLLTDAQINAFNNAPTDMEKYLALEGSVFYYNYVDERDPINIPNILITLGLSIDDSVTDAQAYIDALEAYDESGSALSEFVFGAGVDVGSEYYDDLLDVNWISGNVPQGEDYAGRHGWNYVDGMQPVIDFTILESIFNIYSEPQFAWIDRNDPNKDGTSKANWYTNLYNRMKMGYTALQDGLASSQEWIKFALEGGLVVMEQVDESATWKSFEFNCCSDITEHTDNAAVTKAEAEYNQKMQKIQAKDQRYDLELKNIDTEHNSLQTEYESIKSVIEKNVQRTFKIYS